MEHSRSASPPHNSAKKPKVDETSPIAEVQPVTNGEMSEPPRPPEPSAAPRTIDENTDLTTLTDQEIMRLMEGMDHTEVVLTRVSPLQNTSKFPLYCN